MLLAENIAAAAAGVNTRESNLALPADSAADRMILEVLPLPWRRHMPVRSTDRNLDIAAAASTPSGGRALAHSAQPSPLGD